MKLKACSNLLGTTAIFLMLGACAETVSSSETHISIMHGRAPESIKAAFEMANKHCQQFGRIAVPSVTGRGFTTFKCE